MAERKRRHRWTRPNPPVDTCSHCGAERWWTQADLSRPRVWTYAMPSGKRLIVTDASPVPPCEPRPSQKEKNQ
jgi:hypothetical protein